MRPPAVSLNVSQTGPLAYTASATASSGTIARAVIDFGDGTVVNQSPASHTYGAVGTYLVTAYGYDAAGLLDCSASGTAKTCSPLWGAVTGFIGGGSPAIVNGILYINVSGDGIIYAYSPNRPS